LNLAERFFAEITGKRIRRGAFTSVGQLEQAIRDYAPEVADDVLGLDAGPARG
jgi:hypothetical protein